MNVKEFLSDKYIRTVYIVGKGQSLEFLNASHFQDPHGIVITLNESIVLVENIAITNIIISMQKDGATTGLDCTHRNICQCGENELCRYGMVLPKEPSVILLVSETDSANCYMNYAPRITFNNADYGLEWFEPSVLSAISIAKQIRATEIVMLCFDSYTHGDLINITPTTNERLKDEGYTSQHNRMKNLLLGTNHKFVTPEK